VRYHVTLDPEPTREPIAVDVQDLPSGALEVRVSGRKVGVDVVDVGQQLSVIMDGRVVDLTTEGTPPDLGAVASGLRAYVRVESERQRAADAAKRGKGGSGGKVALSPMPGRVVKVLVSPGDSVAVGQPLVVMEAMKMENEIRAKTAGTVARVHVSAGDTVESNAKLVTLS
jgi:glutaconyl-CoA/methylmalonyl-CoA decarboxylase subunit gamma